MGSPAALLRMPVKPWLQIKREMPWEELVYKVPPYQGGRGHCPAVAGPGDVYSHFLAIKHTGGFHPILNVSKVRMKALNSIIQGLH